MPSQHLVQSAFLAGVLDPRASARVETDAYQQGLLEGVNITPVHLGGVRRRPGLGYRALLPNQLTRVTGITPTAPRGGTAANANDDSETTLLTTTTNVSTIDPYIVCHFDLGSAKAVLFADVLGIVSDGGSSTQFAIQYSLDDLAWTTLGTALPAVDTTARTYRRAGLITARYWRVAKIGGTDMGAVHITISGFNLWQDSGTVSEGREIGWEVSTDERYVLVLTDRSATMFNGSTGAFIDRNAMPYTSADLAELDGVPSAEILFLTHEDYPPRFFVRESTTNFQTFVAEFTNVPQVDFSDASSPTPTSDVQIITFDANWVVGDTFQISMDGARSAAIAYAGDGAVTAANIAREVQKMWVVKAFEGVTCSRTGALAFTVSFTGASADNYGTLTVSFLSSAGTNKGSATVNHSATGVSRREDLWSATRGYPRSAEFFEGRLYMGGTRSHQQSLIGSVVNDILQLDTAEGLDDDAILVTLSGRQLNAINGLFGGRSLQMFTTGGEFRYVKEQGTPITPADSPVNQTQYGSAKIRPVAHDGATLFVQRNRKSIRDYRFDYTENAYNSLGVSSLAPHLIYDVRDLAAWNGSAVDEINLAFVVNGTNPDRSDADASNGVIMCADGTVFDPDDTTNHGEMIFPHGTCGIFNSRKEANVQAWTIWTTQGEFKAVATVLQEIFFLVERTVNGVEGLYFEQADRDLFTDCAVQVTNSPASASVSGLSHLNGEEARVRADGFVLENVTPVAGAATIELDAEDIEVGLDWAVIATPMPLQTFVPGSSSNLMRKKRVVKVRAKVRNTLGLRVNGRPLPDRAFDQDNFDEAAMPFTGTHAIEESSNWDESEDKLVRFTQVDPLPFELLAVDVQLEVSG
ncbi:MAG: hypothetical protein ACREXP_03790 [Steroidobacteraceae bacterium]